LRERKYFEREKWDFFGEDVKVRKERESEKTDTENEDRLRVLISEQREYKQIERKEIFWERKMIEEIEDKVKK
jgi:hypothetical protein